MEIRFGLMCRGKRMPAWQARTLRRLCDTSRVDLALVIQPDRSRVIPDAGSFARIRRLTASSTTAWDTFNNGYVARRSRSLAQVDCGELLLGVPSIEATPERRGKFSEYFSDEDVAAIQGYDLDFILRFAYGIIRGDILDAARYGVWSFHHGDEQEYRGSPPAFWEVANAAPVTGVLLQRLTDRLDGGIVLRKGWFPTAHHSYVANTDRVHFGGVDFPARVCRDILRGHDDYLTAPPSSTSAPVYLKPDDTTTARVVAKAAVASVKRQATNVWLADQWNVGLVREPISRFLEPGFVPTVEWFDDTRGTNHYLADPFALATAAGSVEVYAEDYDYTTRLGSIARLDFRNMSRTTVDHASSAHASYPFTFEHDGQTLVAMQITGLAGVPLFRPDGDRLMPAGRLPVDGEVLDPTLVQHDARWWVFFTRPGETSLTELHIWFADSLHGGWSPHPANPVKTDVRSARPGGTPFVHEGELYRPAQDCSTTYGGAVSINRVDTLTLDMFSESVVRVIEPDPSGPYPHGVHTLSAAGPFTLLDAKRRVTNVRETRTELAARLRRLPGLGS